MSVVYTDQSGFYREALEFVVLASEEPSYFTGVVLSADDAENE